MRAKVYFFRLMNFHKFKSDYLWTSKIPYYEHPRIVIGNSYR